MEEMNEDNDCKPNNALDYHKIVHNEILIKIVLTSELRQRLFQRG